MIAMALAAVLVVALALLWARDVAILARMLRQVDAGAPAVGVPLLPGTARVAREIERLSRSVAARAALLEQLRRADEAIVERLPDPLIVLGADRAALRANAAARASFGTDMAAALRHPELRAAIERAFALRKTQSAQVTLAVPVAREVRATAVFLEPPLADGGTALVVLSDRSQERALERMRADFVANASHELRTPLASLIGFIETLRGPAADDPPAQARFLGIMAEQAARMDRLIDDLLSLSRIELVEHQVPTEHFFLSPLLARVVAGFEPRLAECKVTLQQDIAPDLPAVIGDEDQVAQVVQNLLDNALKYGALKYGALKCGREGGILRLAATPSVAGDRWPARPGVVIAVSDNGQGIPRVHIPRLTERFYRVDAGRSRAAGGTGLGLAIVKHIVNRHRGQLAIESEEGKGTIVSVWLPAETGAMGQT